MTISTTDPDDCPWCHVKPDEAPRFPERLGSTDVVIRCGNYDCPVVCYCYGATREIAVRRWNWRFM